MPSMAATGQRSRALLAVLGIALALSVLTASASAVAASRAIHRFPFDPTDHDPAVTTDLLVGLDKADSNGQRADVVIAVRTDRNGSRAIVIPRDTLVPMGSYVDRLTTSWLAGPDQFTRRLCKIGLPVDHIVTLDFEGLSALVDAVGGVVVTTDAPLRDVKAHLDLTVPGRQRLNGTQALAWVRSRHPERLTGGQWRSAPDLAVQRPRHAADVLQQVGVAVSARPWTLARAARAASRSMQADEGMTMVDLAMLAGTLHSQPAPLTIDSHLRDGPVPIATTTPRGRSQLKDFVGSDECTSRL
jgi:LCP family protein required for cell wall assembly